ncbi:D-alanyl-D-alanine carboxypeptidase [Kineosporia sp. J2-2]|uniref:D-alanyl-D-alanine carboxypeptidase n=1 Tax=Kineosporia corallincola TaxID=2835133 RepID=A0ABS5TQV2_9ACTN|nr:hypothetical protein [Kineosporia corallincola]MBT0772284.1 D-alanyl-D-alanine carboxypeptidase [Kineosporia corallincola]
MNTRLRTIKKRYVAMATAAVAVAAVPVVPTLASAQPVAATATAPKLLVPAGQKVAGSTDISWPSSGRARIEVPGIGTIGQKGSSTESVPIASITKVMTAYTILKDHPLKSGAKGPSITITKADVNSYNRLKGEGAAVVKVKEGTKLTQRQALQGLLIPSGANMAETLARWDAGSTSKFVNRMNANAKALGLDSTSFADPTGLSSDSRSSTEDLLDLATAVMKKASFREIVKTKSVKIPQNTLKSTNKLLGANGVVGIKTGTTYAAGGCLLFAATDTVAGKTRTIYGVMLGARGSAYSTNAQKFSKAMVIDARSELRQVTLVKKGKAVVSVTKSDGKTYKYGVKKTVTAAGWSGLSYKLSLPSGLAAGQTPKQLVIKSGSATIKAALVPLN